MAPPKKKRTAPAVPGAARTTTKTGTPKRVTYRHVGKNTTVTITGGLVDTPNPHGIPPLEKMILVGADAPADVIDAPNCRVTKNKVVVAGGWCVVDGDNCTVTGANCVVNGNDCIVIGNHCVVRGHGANVKGDDCIIAREAIAAKVSGSRCTVRGIVVKMKGDACKLDGGSVFEQTGVSISNVFTFGGSSTRFTNCQVSSHGVNVGAFSSRSSTRPKNVAVFGVAGDNARNTNVTVTGHGNAVSTGGGCAVAYNDESGSASSEDDNA